MRNEKALTARGTAWKFFHGPEQILPGPGPGWPGCGYATDTSMCACMCLCMYVCVDMCVHAHVQCAVPCMCVCMCVHVYTYIICVCTCMCLCMWMCAGLPQWVYTYILIDIIHSLRSYWDYKEYNTTSPPSKVLYINDYTHMYSVCIIIYNVPWK